MCTRSTWSTRSTSSRLVTGCAALSAEHQILLAHSSACSARIQHAPQSARSPDCRHALPRRHPAGYSRAVWHQLTYIPPGTQCAALHPMQRASVGCGYCGLALRTPEISSRERYVVPGSDIEWPVSTVLCAVRHSLPAGQARQAAVWQRAASAIVRAPCEVSRARGRARACVRACGSGGGGVRARA